MKNIKTKTKVIFVIIVLIIIGIVFILFSSKKTGVSSSVSITNSIPANDALGVSVFDPVTLTFNQPVNASSFYASSDPSEVWNITQYSPNTIQLNHAQYLRVYTSYKITILYNERLIEILNFQTANEQNDPRELQTIQEEQNKDYPLLSLTPYDTSDYRVVYVGPLTLEIYLKSSINPQDAILQVQSWVQSNKVDPTTHKYNVVTASSAPSPNPAP